jgi:hypothetical protein
MKENLGGPRHILEDDIKIDLKWDTRTWSVFIWLRIGTGGGPL